jgi:hypothetical protein
MRLPQKKKPGDPIMAEDWNLLLDAIAARTPRPGDGLKFISSSGGFAYAAQKPVDSIPGQPPFSVIGIAKADTGYLVTIKEGWVIERRPRTADHPHVRFHMPEFDGTALDALPRPQIPMSFGDTLWCRIQTDAMGEITGTVGLLVDPDAQDGVHYFPEDPEGSGQPGDYRVKLLKLENDSGVPRVKVYQQSDIGHWAQLWTGRNLGTGARVYQEHDEAANLYKFRSIKGLAPLKAEENGDEIEVSADGANINWEIYQTTFSHDVEGHLVATRATMPEFTVYIRHGLVVGLVDPEDDPEDLQTIASDRNSVPAG